MESIKHEIDNLNSKYALKYYNVPKTPFLASLYFDATRLSYNISDDPIVLEFDFADRYLASRALKVTPEALRRAGIKDAQVVYGGEDTHITYIFNPITKTGQMIDKDFLCDRFRAELDRIKGDYLYENEVY